MLIERFFRRRRKICVTIRRRRRRDWKRHDAWASGVNPRMRSTAPRCHRRPSGASKNTWKCGPPSVNRIWSWSTPTGTTSRKRRRKKPKNWNLRCSSIFMEHPLSPERHLPVSPPKLFLPVSIPQRSLKDLSKIPQRSFENPIVSSFNQQKATDEFQFEFVWIEVTDEAESSDKENAVAAVVATPAPPVVVRPKRNRYRQRRRGFHQQMASSSQPHLGHPATANFHPSLSQEILDAFCMPVNALDAVDADPCRPMRNPQRPSRTLRLKKMTPPSVDGNHLTLKTENHLTPPHSKITH